MQIGYIGLGKMGSNMATRLLEKNFELVVWNRSLPPMEKLVELGAESSTSLSDLAKKLKPKRIIWLMLPSGETTLEKILELSEILSPHDVVIDGGNSFYKDSQTYEHILQKKQIDFIDCGVSGGPAGARNGATCMIGGKLEVYQSLIPLFEAISAPGAYEFFEGVGSGHFVKMVHNGIEYGMMQAIAEGFDLMKKSGLDLDLKKVAQIYAKKSVIESRLISWMQKAFEEYGNDLLKVSGSAGSGGSAGMEKSEAKWTIDVAKEKGVEVSNIQSAIDLRIRSQDNPNFQGKIINALRNQFGGHSIDKTF